MARPPKPPKDTPNPAQELPGLEAFGMETGLTQLPEGASELTAQELRFVLGMLRHGRQRKAAIEAGYSETSADQIASETIRKPRVAAFYRKCLEAFGADARAAIARTEQRARMLDAMAVGGLEQIEALSPEEQAKLVLIGAKLGKDGKSEYETAGVILKRETAEALKLALDHDKVLISAGTSAKVEISGQLKGGEIIITPAVLSVLTGIREGKEVVRG